MEIYEKILWLLSGWTLLEGSLVLIAPQCTIRITRRLFPKWGNALEGTPPSELRKLGAIELVFGLLLGAYLLIFA